MKTSKTKSARTTTRRRRVSIGTASFHVHPNATQLFLPGDDIEPSFVIPANTARNYEATVQHLMRLHKRLGYAVNRSNFNAAGVLVPAS